MLQAVDDAAQPDIKQPDLSVQVVDFLFQWTRPASPAPVRPHRSGHEIDCHDETQWQHSTLRVTLKLLQDVQARQGKERDSGEPEEAAEQGVQQVKETPQEHGEEPVGHENGCHKEKESCRRVGERRETEVVAEVWGYGENKKQGYIKPQQTLPQYVIFQHWFLNLQSMPITSSKSDQIFQMVSRNESTPWTNRSVVLEKNYNGKRKTIIN